MRFVLGAQFEGRKKIRRREATGQRAGDRDSGFGQPAQFDAITGSVALGRRWRAAIVTRASAIMTETVAEHLASKKQTESTLK